MTELNSIFAPDAFSAGAAGPLYLRLKALIQGAIQDGSLNANDALPSEREIASMLDISRVTVRKALAELVEDGVLTQKRGSGTFVARGNQHGELRGALGHQPRVGAIEQHRGMLRSRRVEEGLSLMRFDGNHDCAPS